LSDQQIQQFIRDGYLLVRADGCEPLHAHIRQKVDRVFEEEGNVGNNLLPRVPEIRQVLADPAIHGALTSLLGPGYILNPHRHGHNNPPGSKGQTWHKDCYVRDHNIRHPRFRWILALYYPQDVTEEMGPTGILPRWHNYRHVSDHRPEFCREEALGMCGPAGTVALCHFDVWHRATANISDKKRYMLKFGFARMVEPTGASWDHRGAAWELPVEPHQEAFCRDVWGWLRGRQSADRMPGRHSVDDNLEALRGDNEQEQRRAAFEVAAQGDRVVGPLLEILREQAEAAAPTIEANTPDNAHGTNPTAVPAAQALVAAGSDLIPHLLPALEDDHWLVRASVADALGWMGAEAAPAREALSARLADEHWWVRRNAVEALGWMNGYAAPMTGRLVPLLDDPDKRVRRVTAMALAQLHAPTPGAVPGLERMLNEEDRYNRFYAGLALRHLPEPEAREALLDSLFDARWCSITNSKNPY
jgi:hypothetical protein